jgi:hypothetical protein
MAVQSKTRRSILLHGLGLVLSRPGALLWTYAFNLGTALLFSLRFHLQLAGLLDHSLAAERLNTAFDLGTLIAALQRLNHGVPSAGPANYLGLPLYLLLYFIVVPGTLFCYQTASPARLPILLSLGLQFFWRFVRVTLLTLLGGGLIVVPLLLRFARFSDWVDDRFVGIDVYLYKLAALVPILLVALLLRLYFDLVEVYTVHLNDQLRPDGTPDRRVRRVLLHAWRSLRRHFADVYLSFVALTLLGFTAFAALARIATHMLAQPHSLPMFLLAQAGLLLMLATRFWQRGAETILALDFPLPLEPAGETIDLLAEREIPREIHNIRPGPRPIFVERLPPDDQPVQDAQSDPEPAAPSLQDPDPGVFRHPRHRPGDDPPRGQ